MKSIKPGRGPSRMNAAGSIFAAIFGVFWCIIAGSMGASFMIPFGILFVGFAIYQAVYHGHNATSDERYSVFDIVDSDEEEDPLNVKHKPKENKEIEEENGTFSEIDVAYCPYCGRQVDGDFEYCPKCGKKLPE